MEYEQGKNISLYATFTNHQGEQVIVTSGSYMISREIPSGKNIILSGALTQDGGSSTFFTTWNIPTSITKGTYHVRYVGLFSDGIIAVGAEEFQVIPRKFYDKRGGGTVARVSKGTEWSTTEKKQVITDITDLTKMIVVTKEAIDDLKTRTEVNGLSEQEDKIDKISDSLSLLSKDIGNLSGLEEKIASHQSSTESNIGILINDLKEKMIDSGTEKVDLSGIEGTLKSLKEEYASLREIKDKMNSLSSIRLELDDISNKVAGVDELKELYLKTMPKEKLVKSVKKETLVRVKNDYR